MYPRVNLSFLFELYLLLESLIISAPSSRRQKNEKELDFNHQFVIDQRCLSIILAEWTL